MSEIDKLSNKYGKSTAKATKLYNQYKETGNENKRIKAKEQFAKADAYMAAIQNMPDIHKSNHLTINASKTDNRSYFSGNSASVKYPKKSK